MATTGQREVALGSFTAALSLATYLSFLEGLLGQLVASLQPCEGVVGRVLCWEHELGETPSQGETGLWPSHMQQHLRERVQGLGTPQKALLLQSNGGRHIKVRPLPQPYEPHQHPAFFHCQCLGKLRHRGVSPHLCPHSRQMRGPSSTARASKHSSAAG